jgi:tRNA-binding EMAP/Myf-like protein
MQDALVCVIANLKPRKLGGFESHGMVLCAETEDKSVIELLIPPQGSVPGDKVHFPGSERNPPEALPNKNNAWDKTVDDLKINDKKVANYKGQEFTVEGKGVCTAKTLTAGVIH